MEVFKNGSRASIDMSNSGYFTGGHVRLDPQFDIASDPQGKARAGAGHVTFEPSARTNWHTHPIGQLLLVTAGRGFVQKHGEPAQVIQAGDVVWIAADEQHWHGAAKDTMMSHFAINEAEDGEVVTWLEPVSDEDYLQAQI